jgi:hypothetical protein
MLHTLRLCTLLHTVLTSQHHDDSCFRQQGAHSRWHSWIQHVPWCDVSVVHGLRKFRSLQDQLCWGTFYRNSCSTHVL